jgi:hypothetical protein
MTIFFRRLRPSLVAFFFAIDIHLLYRYEAWSSFSTPICFSFGKHGLFFCSIPFIVTPNVL